MFSEFKLIIFLLVVASVILSLLYLRLLIVNQRNTNVLHFGWILFIALCAYGFLFPTYILFLDIENLEQLDFKAFFNENSFIKIFLIYIFCLIGFVISEVIINKIRIRNEKIFQLNNFQLKVILFIAFLFISFGIYQEILILNSFGGFVDFLLSPRGDRSVFVKESGFIFSSVNFFHIGILFSIIYVLMKHKSKVRYVIYFIFLSYLFLSFIKGSRLEILVILLTLFSMVFYFYKNYTMVNLKKYLYYFLIIIIIFLLWQEGRNIVTFYLLTGEINLDLFKFKDLSNSEFSTGYISGLILDYNKNSINTFYSYFDMFPFIPSSFLESFGITKPLSLTEQISVFQTVRPLNPMYTTTLPIDIYFSSGIFVFMIFILFLYVGIYVGIYVLQNRLPMFGIMFNFIIILNIYFIFRLELVNSFGKIYRDVFLLIIAYCMYLVIISFFRYFLRRKEVFEKSNIN